MAKKNVVIFDGEDKFINPKKVVYSKSKGQAKKVESFKSMRAASEDEQNPSDGGGSATQEPVTQVGVQNTVAPPVAPIEVPSQNTISNIPLPNVTEVINGSGSSIPAPQLPEFPTFPQPEAQVTPSPVPALPVYATSDIKATPISNIQTSTVTKETVMAPVPQLPSFSASSPVSGLGLSFGQNATTKSCPPGFRDYFGTCIPITNTQGACQQGYMKEYEGGPCVPIPASGSIGGCAAGYEYKLGYRSGSLTPEMGCYPIGSTQDINTGSSTGKILGGGAGTNIGGGGTVQGGGGSYADTSEKQVGIGQGGQSTGLTCNENQIYDPKTGSCMPKYTPAPVPCPAGFTVNKATGTCIESLNPQDYKCPPVDLPTPPKCKKYAVVGKDTFGCDRFELVDDAANCPDVIQEKPIECKDGLIYSEALKKCVNPIDETKRPPLTTPEGTCPVGYDWSIAEQKCISKCEAGKTYDPVNMMCVEPTPYTPKTPYCSANQVWDEAQQKCVFSGIITKPPVTSQTTTTTTKAPEKDSLGILPVGGGTTGGGGGGGGGEDTSATIAKKNYFWWYVGGAILAIYLYKNYHKKKKK